MWPSGSDSFREPRGRGGRGRGGPSPGIRPILQATDQHDRKARRRARPSHCSAWRLGKARLRIVGQPNSFVRALSWRYGGRSRRRPYRRRRLGLQEKRARFGSIIPDVVDTQQAGRPSFSAQRTRCPSPKTARKLTRPAWCGSGSAGRRSRSASASGTRDGHGSTTRPGDIRALEVR